MASKDLVLVSLKCSCPKIHISLSFSSLCSPLFVINALFFWLLEHCGRGGKIANLKKTFLSKTYLKKFFCSTLGECMAGKIKTCCRRRNVPLKKCKSLLPDNWVFNPQQLVISLWTLEEGYMINGKLASMITQPLLHLHIKYLQLLLTLVPKLKTIMITAAIWQHVSWWTILLMPIIPLPIILVITIILISNPTMTTTMTSMASASIPLSLWLPRPRQPPVFTLWHLCDFLMPDKQNTQHTQKCSTTTTTPFHFSGSFYHFHLYFIHITYVCIEHLFWKLSPFFHDLSLRAPLAGQAANV